MKTPAQAKLDAIAARALHDPEMRAILSDEFDVIEADTAALRDALDAIPPRKRERLFERSEELEQTSGRTNALYAELSHFAQRRWRELIREPNERATAFKEEMEPARQAVAARNADLYEHYRTRFTEQGKEVSEAVAEARNELRRDIRRMIAEKSPGIDTQTRAPLVDHLTRAAPVPAAVADAMGAARQLEAFKARQDLLHEQNRHLGRQSAPRADLGI
jgi:uncharacterized protein YicC (UPF0701 family)